MTQPAAVMTHWRLVARRMNGWLRQWPARVGRLGRVGLGDHSTDLASGEPAGSQAPPDVARELAKLADLKTQDLLTDTEFTAAKQKLLAQP
jgi:hypothetical protein